MINVRKLYIGITPQANSSPSKLLSKQTPPQAGDKDTATTRTVWLNYYVQASTCTNEKRDYASTCNYRKMK